MKKAKGTRPLIHVPMTVYGFDIRHPGDVYVWGKVGGTEVAVLLRIKEAIEEQLIDPRWHDWDSMNVTIKQYIAWLKKRRHVNAKYPNTEPTP